MLQPLALLSVLDISLSLYCSIPVSGSFEFEGITTVLDDTFVKSLVLLGSLTVFGTLLMTGEFEPG